MRGHSPGVKLVIDPDTARPRDRHPTGAAIAGHRDQWRDMDTVGHHPGVFGLPLPRQREGEQARVPGGGFDGVAVARPVGLDELERPGGLHRAAPHLDIVGEAAGHDGHRVEPEVPSDPWVVQPGAQQDRGRTQRARREDDDRRTDREFSRSAAR